MLSENRWEFGAGSSSEPSRLKVVLGVILPIPTLFWTVLRAGCSSAGNFGFPKRFQPWKPSVFHGNSKIDQEEQFPKPSRLLLPRKFVDLPFGVKTPIRENFIRGPR